MKALLINNAVGQTGFVGLAGIAAMDLPLGGCTDDDGHGFGGGSHG